MSLQYINRQLRQVIAQEIAMDPVGPVHITPITMAQAVLVAVIIVVLALRLVKDGVVQNIVGYVLIVSVLIVRQDMNSISAMKLVDLMHN